MSSFDVLSGRPKAVFPSAISKSIVTIPNVAGTTARRRSRRSTLRNDLMVSVDLCVPGLKAEWTTLGDAICRAGSDKYAFR